MLCNSKRKIPPFSATTSNSIELSGSGLNGDKKTRWKRVNYKKAFKEFFFGAITLKEITGTWVRSWAVSPDTKLGFCYLHIPKTTTA